MANYVVDNVRLKLTYLDNKGSVTYSNIRKDASDQSVYDLGIAIAALQDWRLNNIMKIVENKAE